MKSGFSLKPVILLAFANDQSLSLRYLDEEQRIIKKILHLPEKEGKCKVIVLPAATATDVISAFQEHRNQIAIFHYGGHSDSDQIFFHQEYQQQTHTTATNLAEFLALQDGLQLVFLNSCLSLPMAEAFHHAGVKAVLATGQAIGDKGARYFAELFYTALATGATLGGAYLEAEKAFKIQYEELFRGIILESKEGEFSWQLSPDTLALWRLPMVAKTLTSIPNLHVEKEMIGRDEEMKQLKRAIEQTKRGLVVYGLGGVGKTVLVTAYVQLFGYEFDHLVWISDRDQALTSIIALHPELADTLGIPFEEEEQLEDRFHRILWKMQQLPGNNLMVIDNAKEEVSNKDFYDRLTGAANWKLLLTARQELQGFENLQLGDMNHEAALALFCTYYQGTVNDKDLAQLLRELGHHPLSVELFAKLLSKSDHYLSPGKLLEIIQQHQLKEVSPKEKIWTRHSKEERPILLHLIKAFEVSNLTQEEIWLLKQFTVLPPNHLKAEQLALLLKDQLVFWCIESRLSNYRGIGKISILLLNALRKVVPEILIISLFKKTGWLSKHENMKALSKLNGILLSLTAKGWLTRGAENAYTIHRLIQQVIRYQIKITYKDLEALCGGLMNVLFGHPKLNPLHHSLTWVPHAAAVSSFLNKKNSFHLKWIRSLLANWYYQWLNDYQKAKELIELNLKFNKKEYERYSEMVSLSNIYLKLGNPSKALEVAKNAYESRQSRSRLSKYLYIEKILKLNKLINLNKKVVAHSQADLAWIYFQIGDLPKARTLFESAWEALKEEEETHTTIKLKHNLALVYSAMGEFQKSTDLFEEVLQFTTKEYIENHPNLAIEYANLGDSYHNLGRYQEASELLNKAIAILTINYGEEHPKTQGLIHYVNLNKIKWSESNIT